MQMRTFSRMLYNAITRRMLLNSLRARRLTQRHVVREHPPALLRRECDLAVGTVLAIEHEAGCGYAYGGAGDGIGHPVHVVFYANIGSTAGNGIPHDPAYPPVLIVARLRKRHSDCESGARMHGWKRIAAFSPL